MSSGNCPATTPLDPWKRVQGASRTLVTSLLRPENSFEADIGRGSCRRLPTAIPDKLVVEVKLQTSGQDHSARQRANAKIALYAPTAGP